MQSITGMFKSVFHSKVRQSIYGHSEPDLFAYRNKK
jgi:hypothetical protein